MEGKPVTTQYYTQPLAVTTFGMHNFAPGVQLEDFSAKYETVFTPKEAGEYVVNVDGCGQFELYIDGERKFRHRIWRTTPNRVAIQAEKGKSYIIEVRFAHVPTYNANLAINVAKELPIDYNQTIAQLKGIDKVVFVGFRLVHRPATRDRDLRRYRPGLVSGSGGRHGRCRRTLRRL